MTENQSILIICDNFLIGGRETYIETCLSQLSSQPQNQLKKNDEASYTASLLANKIDARFTSTLFSKTIAVENHDSLLAWLDAGGNVISQQRPTCIWAHHYALLPAFLLAVEYELPLVVSLHGAPFTAGKYTSLSDRLGFSLAAQQKASFTAVSEEIREQMVSLGFNKNNVTLTRNAVAKHEVGNRLLEKQNSNSKECILLTRPQKLAHIRESVLLCSMLNQLGLATNLAVYLGYSLNQSQMVSKSKFLGRKWLLKNPHVLKYLHRINIQPPAMDKQKIIDQADIVLGMGRVVLEGIMAKKPTVLIGYDAVKGLVTSANFSEYQYSNFSGRNIQSSTVREVGKQVMAHYPAANDRQQTSQQLSQQQYDSISVPVLCEKLHGIFQQAPIIESVENDCRQDISLFKNAKINEEQLLNKLASGLSNEYQRVLSRLEKEAHNE